MFIKQCNVALDVYADLCSLLAASSQFSIFICEKMQMIGCHRGNMLRNATCVETHDFKASNSSEHTVIPILCLDRFYVERSSRDSVLQLIYKLVQTPLKVIYFSVLKMPVCSHFSNEFGHLIGNLHVRLTFNLSKANKIFYSS